jgi:glycosyltransferase involved in cell wall biosynthesis
MLCGTPVAATRLGAVPEIISEGVTGFSVESLAQMPGAIVKCFSLDRRRVRQVAEERFSVEHMTDGYLRVFEQVIARSNLA